MTHVLNALCRYPVFAGIALLSACGYPQVKGQWQPLESPVLVFSGVQLAEEVKDRAYPDVCTEAVEDIDRQLRRRLPARIRPLVLRHEKPAGNDYAELLMQVTECRLDSDQAGGAFSFYLGMNLTVSVSDKGRRVMRYSMKTGEQAQTDTPNPSWIFTFEEPFRRTLMLFEEGRVLVPQGGTVNSE